MAWTVKEKFVALTDLEWLATLFERFKTWTPREKNSVSDLNRINEFIYFWVGRMYTLQYTESWSDHPCL